MMFTIMNVLDDSLGTAIPAYNDDMTAAAEYFLSCKKLLFIGNGHFSNVRKIRGDQAGSRQNEDHSNDFPNICNGSEISVTHR